MKENKKIHKAWFVLIACCAVQAGGAGTLVNCAGIFFSPVAKSLGVGIGEVSLYFTITSLCLAFSLPLAGKMLPKLNIRILLPTGIIICDLCVAAMSQFTAVWQWYIAGAILGIAGAFIFIITSPIIIGNWFHKKLGLAMGITMSFNGIGGAIINPILSSAITNLGWRNAYLVMSIISAIIVLPFTLFVVRFKPEDIGLKPYGYEESVNSVANDTNKIGVPAKIAKKSIAFYIMFISFGLIGFLGGYSQQLPAFANSIKMPATLGAILVSLSLLVSVGGKLTLGILNDKFGIKVVTIGGTLVVIIAFALLIFNNGNYTMVLIGSAFYGVSQTINAVALPLITRETFGSREYSSIFANLAMGQNLIGAFGYSAIGFIYDKTGSYSANFILGIILCIVFILLTLIALSSGKKLKSQISNSITEVA